MINKMSKIVLAVLCFGACVFVNNIEASTDKIIAIVNNSVITQSELDNKLIVMKQHLEHTASAPSSTAQLRQKVLDDLIDKDLQLQIAANNNIKVSDQEVTDAISSIAQRNKLTLAQMQQELAKQGVKYQDFRKQIHEDILIGRLVHQVVGQKVNVTEQEVDAVLRKGKPANLSENSMKIYHVLDVLIPTTAHVGEAEYDAANKVVADLLAQLRKGADVDVVVRNTSFAGKPLVGSDFGLRPLGEFPDLFKTIIPTLKPHDAAGPIAAPNGLHIIILLEIKSDGGQSDVGMTREDAREIVYRNKIEKVLKPWLKQLRDTAYVKILSP